jgi:multiple sugar transport system permease protein
MSRGERPGPGGLTAVPFAAGASPIAPPARRTARRLARAVDGAKWCAFYLVVCLGAVVMLVPIVWMLATAAKPLAEAASPEFILVPSQFVLWDNVQAAFRRVPMGTYFYNSTVVSLCTVSGELFFCSLAGFSFAKYSYPGRDLLFTLVLSTMMIPFFVVVIPVYIVVYSFGWLNTYWGLIVPGLVSAFGIFLMRQWMLGIPSELLDAARIDGSSEFGVFGRIVLPLSGPALATLAILSFMSSWDSYIWPLLVVSKKSLMTVPLGLTLFQSEWQVYWNELMAASLIFMLPTFLVFLVFQRQFVQGVTMTGLKG